MRSIYVKLGNWWRGSTSQILRTRFALSVAVTSPIGATLHFFRESESRLDGIYLTAGLPSRYFRRAACIPNESKRDVPTEITRAGYEIQCDWTFYAICNEVSGGSFFFAPNITWMRQDGRSRPGSDSVWDAPLSRWNRISLSNDSRYESMSLCGK